MGQEDSSDENVDGVERKEGKVSLSPPSTNIGMDGKNNFSQQNKNGRSHAEFTFIDDLQHQFWKVFTTVQNFAQRDLMDRKTICTILICNLITVVGFGGLLLTTLLSIMVVLCPIWLPVALFTFLVWFPLTVFTLPLLLSVAITIGACTLAAVTIAFFFAWPEEWLPSKESSRAVALYLRQRDNLTLQLARIQAKLLLYAAGVGPAADAAFMVLDRVDVQAIAHKLRELDWGDLGFKVKHGQLQELQKLALEIIQSSIR